MFPYLAHLMQLSFLYVMAANATSVMVMSLDAPGKATPVQQFNFTDDATKHGATIGVSTFH
jgi:hypothetical protein